MQFKCPCYEGGKCECNNDSVEELAKRLYILGYRSYEPGFEDKRNDNDIWNHCMVKDTFLKIAREVKIIEIEARLDEIVKVPRTEQYFYDRKHELTEQLNTLKGAHTQ